MKNDETIVLIEANKGEAVIKHLENKNKYKKADPFGDTKTIRANNALNKNNKNSFLKQEIDYLTSFQQESSNFYSFPKIYKSTFHVSNQKI